MKIAVWHNLAGGGSQRALYHHVRGLLKRGHDVQVWCPPTADRTYLPLSEMVPEHVVHVDYQPPQPFSWSLSFLRRRRKWISRLTRALDRHSRQCAAEIADWGCDVLFAHSCRYLAAGLIGRYVTGRPAVIYLHEPTRRMSEANPTPLWAARPAPARSPGSGIIRACAKDLIGWAKDRHDIGEARRQLREEVQSAAAYDMILVNSLYSRESVIRAYNLDAHVCYLGIDADLFRPLGLARERLVVGLGAVMPHKRVDAAIRAIACLVGVRPPLLWIGSLTDEGYQAQMQRLAHSLGVDLRIRSGVSDCELVQMLNRAAVMLFTSHLEPFGFAPLEASACGTPVVAVPEGGVRESMREGVTCLFSEREPKKLAAAVQRLLDDPGMSSQIRQAGPRYVREHWTWNKAVDRLESRLIEAVQGVPKGRRDRTVPDAHSP
jgi:glycosyltransferase involved in cell wall biosynthesis